MELTPRQLETIENLKKKEITSPDQIVRYCEGKLLQPNWKGKKRLRRHSKEYYQQIIKFYSGVKTKNPASNRALDRQ